MEDNAYRDMIEAQETHWWFRARRKVLARLLQRFVPRGGRVLDVGAGTGSNLPLLEGFGTVTALEPNPFAADHLSRSFGVEVVREAVPAATHPSLSAFDLIAALDVLEHIEEEAQAFEFMAQRLRPGGWLVVTVPAFGFLWSSHDERLRHKRRYRRPELAAKLARAGLAVEFLSYFNCLLFPPALAVRLLDRRRPGIAQAGAKPPPAILNRCLEFTFGLEAGLLGWLRLPFGLSIVALARKSPERLREAIDGNRCTCYVAPHVANHKHPSP